MKYLSALAAACYGLMTILVAVALAWFLLAKVNYAYGIWHDHAGIAQAIETYAPENRFRKGFEETSREQRIRLFADIASAVHRQGEGLEDISYQLTGQKIASPLLHNAEVVHLQDVARLIDLLTKALLLITFVWVGLSAYLLGGSQSLPTAKSQLMGFIALLMVLIALLLSVGWVDVFNQLHIWVFPKEHQWFFYYQDSLMSTMMWAPNLFKYIGISGFFLASIFYGLLLVLLHYLQSREWLSRLSAYLFKGEQ